MGFYYPEMDKLPLEQDSRKEIEKDAPAAIAYLVRTDNMDLVGILGLLMD